MKLSVLVPAFNLNRYIEPCLRSLLSQSVNFNYEVIVCDDASTDGTDEIINRLWEGNPNYQTCLKPIFKKNNGGLAANMQTLLNEANGDYIAYMDGDDLALPGKLQIQVDYLDQNPQCHMVFHESEVFDSGSYTTLRLYTQDHYNWGYINFRSGVEEIVRYGTYMQAGSVMFRRHEHLSETVPSDCKIILDYPFYLLNACYLKARIDFLPKILGRYRVHDSSFGAQTARSIVRRIQAMEDMIHACRLTKDFGVEDAIIQAGIAHHYYCAALYFVVRGHDDLFAKYIEKSNHAGFVHDEKHASILNACDRPDEVRGLLSTPTVAV